jgi:hypothetical protein
MMKEKTIVCEIIFGEQARQSFKFPLTGSIRTSFWIPNSKASTFSEIEIGNRNIDVGELTTVEIKIIERDFLHDKVKVGTEFMVGTFPNSIASGKILGIQNT